MLDVFFEYEAMTDGAFNFLKALLCLNYYMYVFKYV